MNRRTCLLLALAGPALLGVIPAVRSDEAPKGLIAYSRKDGERFLIHVMNADGTGDRVLGGQTATVNMFPAWSPDGKKLAYMNGEKSEGHDFAIIVANADGTGAKSLNLPYKLVALPAWSPDGKKLAFAAGDDFPDIYTADADGTGLRKLNKEGTGAAFAFWFPDGKRVGYTRIQRDVPKTQVVLAFADGSGDQTAIEADGIAVAGPHALSPDAKRLVYAVLDPMKMNGSLRIWEFAAKSEIFLADLPAKEIRGPLGFMTGTWAPDGSSLVVSLPGDKGTGLYRMTPDGKTKTRLTPEGAECLQPAWILPK